MTGTTRVNFQVGLTLKGCFLAWATSSAHITGQPCLCSALLPAGLQVNCSSLNLMQLPHLPSDTTELYVQDNLLTSVSPGFFDRLVGLKKVSLSGNPFHCDCRIQYLRSWLLRNRAVVSKEPVCASPSSVAQRAITELSEDYFSSCSLAVCTEGTYDTVMGVMLSCLIVLLLWSLRLAKTATFTLYIHERHSGFESDSLRSLKPKHRRRLHTAQSEVSADSLTIADVQKEPLINMELLPQVLDVLHKKHNIKIKAT
ncbi:platelet glycoprotein IX [Cottoperca gobio]|uniref:Platelet glycoprotein IX n=1 Tax=Cottoperca gobio TaxID=56716 RepID=A0A6J2Q3T3_COTGO|nr:platelet glycoprotein IX-like [Cottoperca gobio]